MLLNVPCEQRLHFRCVSWCAKSSLCRQLFKSVQKSGRINLKSGFFPVLDRCRALRESRTSLAWQIRVVAILLFLQNSCCLTTDLTINFACQMRDEFCARTIENWMVVSRGYFSHASSHSENVASARRVAKNSHLYGNSTYISIIIVSTCMHLQVVVFSTC